MNTISRLFALIKKEYLELIRDQRSLIATFAYALIGPILLFAIIKGIIGSATEETKLTVGIQQDPRYEQAIADISHYFATENIDTIAYQGELPASFKRLDSQHKTTEGIDFDVLIKISKPSNATSSEKYVIEVYGDKSSQATSKKMAMASSLMAAFVSQQKQDAILKRGIAPNEAMWSLRNHVVNEQTVSANKLRESLLIFLLLAPFFITLNYINDATAGERERGSLMPLLTQPVDRALLVLSKWSVGSVLGIVGTVVTMILGFKLIAGLPIYEIGMSLNASAQNMALTLAIIAPLALLVASLQMLIALAAKNFKEGQSYLTLFSFIPTVAVFTASKFEGLAWAKLTPLIGHQQMLQGVFAGQAFDVAQYAGLSLVCVVAALAALVPVKQQFNSEAILQGR